MEHKKYKIIKSENNNIFDIVIIGAGITGCYLANRLSNEFPNKQILIIEKNNRINFTNNTYYQGLNDIFYGWNDSLKERVITNFTTIINNCTDSCEVYFKAFNKIWSRMYFDNNKWFLAFNNKNEKLNDNYGVFSDRRKYTKDVFDAVNTNCRTKDDDYCDVKYMIHFGEPTFDFETGGRRKTRRKKTNKRRKKNKKTRHTRK